MFLEICLLQVKTSFKNSIRKQLYSHYDIIKQNHTLPKQSTSFSQYLQEAKISF